MIDVRQIYTEVFKAIKNDTQILDLLEIEYLGVENNIVTANVRKQVLDTNQPDDLLTNYKTRICVTEEPANRGSNDEIGYIRLDVLVTQDNNKKDRRMLKIIKRLVEILDTHELNIRGYKQLPVGLYGLNIRRRMPKENTYAMGWDKYSLVFEYKYIVNL